MLKKIMIMIIATVALSAHADENTLHRCSLAISKFSAEQGYLYTQKSITEQAAQKNGVPYVICSASGSLATEKSEHTYDFKVYVHSKGEQVIGTLLK